MSDDKAFYDRPRFVYHIDEGAVGALTKHYADVLPPSNSDGDAAVLDMCSSWVSHYPPGYKAGRVVGLGLNGDELAKNEALTEWVVHDLNDDPTLPFPDATFDAVTNAVSVDYLARPLDVFREVHRVLKPGGTAHFSFSNRCFPTKAIALWTATGDADHVWIVGAYFHYAVAGGFTEPRAVDITPPRKLGGATDPMYVVSASKVA
jgi:SAM-dependent methyltransferase